MKYKNYKNIIACMLAFVFFGLANEAMASHFRFAHLTWSKVSGNTVNIKSRQAWRLGTGSAAVSVDGVFKSGGSIVAQPVDLAGLTYDVWEYNFTHTFPTSGIHTLDLNSCCRIGGLANPSSSFRVLTEIDLSQQGSSVSSITPILQWPQGPHSITLPGVDPDGGPISFRMATSAESGISSVPSTGSGTLSVSSSGVLSWDASTAAHAAKYAAQVILTQGGSDTALDFIIEINANVTGNSSPACSLSGAVNNTVAVGVPFSISVTGTDPDGDNLTVSHLGLPSGATLSPVAGTTQASPATVTFNWTPASPGVEAVTIVFTDPFNQSCQSSFSINVPSNQTPVAKCKNVTVDADTTCKASANIDNGSFDPDGASDIDSITQNPPGPYALVDSPVTVTLTITDKNGANDQCTATVTVVDNTPPTIAVPANTTVECPGDTSTGANGTATGADNCNQFSINYSDSSVAGCGNTEVITRTWTVTDFAGNLTSGDQTITVVDTTPPSLTVPADATVECTDDTSSASTGVATGSDTCGSVNITESDSSVATCGNTKVITRTWTATDDCGNSTSGNQTITVVDTTPPTIDHCPPDVTVELDVNCDADTSPTLTGTGIATGSDTCGSVVITSSDEIVTGCGNNRVITRTWTATDDCLNTTECVQIITVQDSIKPVVTATLVPVKVKKKHGCFRVEFSATDNCDDEVDITAELNGHPVTNGELVRLHHKNHKKKGCRVKVDDGSSDDSGSDDDSSADCGTVKFECTTFELIVTATDDCGNADTASDDFVFEGGSSDDSDSHDNGIHRGNDKDDDHSDSGKHKSEGKSKKHDD